MRPSAVAVVAVVVAMGVAPALAAGATPLVGTGDAWHGTGDALARAGGNTSSVRNALPLAQQEGTVVGRPTLELAATDNRFGAGERVTLGVFVSNEGDIDRGGPAEYEQRVTTARNIRLEVDEDRMNRTLRRGIDVRTDQVFAGSVPEGVSGPFAFDLEISESLSPGTYRLPVEVTYDYTNFVRYGPNVQPEYGDGSRS